MNEYIEIIHARENNLKNVSLKIPKNKITIFTGVSGSGKSSIVFDTIAQEAGRQLNETYDSFTRLFLPKYSRPEVDEINNLSTAIVVNQKKIGGSARSTLGTITDINALFRVLFSRFATPSLGYANAYSFNDPSGMCSVCQGIGKTIALDVEKAVDHERSLNEGAILLPGFTVGSWYWKLHAETGLFDPDKKINKYTPEEYQLLMYADAQKITTAETGDMNVTYEGIVTRFMRTTIHTEKETSKRAAKVIEEFTVMKACPSCAGKRYNSEVLASTIDGYNIHDVTSVQLTELIEILKEIDNETRHPIIIGIQKRVQDLVDIGLGYMDLCRETNSLSGGESQRVKMVKQLASSLTNMIYIFDEPSTGLHPRDVYRLNELLRKIRDVGNTVLVVEHDPDVIQIADYIVDVGPFAGTHGGEITFTGSYEELLQSDTLTGKSLKQSLPINEQPRLVNDYYESQSSSLHNLKNIQLRVPKGIFTAITGVAGSGKSTLVNQVFAKDYPDAIQINQTPIHTNKRSNPATYTGIMNSIRKSFAKASGMDAGYFSYNSKGACPECNGSGTIELNLSFMDKSEVECTHCHGKRYNPTVLEHVYQGKNIVEVMDMTIEEAVVFFDAKDIQRKLKNLQEVGIGYLTLGQPMDTLSGGEAQRLKLANELKTNGNIYILDEPTTGLHMSDVKNVIRIINNLVEKGNTVIVIEHNVDVIRNADWVIDLGPDGGRDGGEILFEGTVKELRESTTITGKYV
ncbi:excinuclease ABC subunit A [Enterococcus sp. DIV2402]|uniref:UvrABC system protein A n=1 Tax=Candidatus Enterococcus lowellii TaxID=2230877 RepID=A0ABZ2SQU9_9ENTE|nr:excinuclease ABC subunit UvrA [Enterococcus sp. DIV2402]MBO0465792.1 excinuclease ABC subunit UvrA [Enterococcus sp. DIV2402]